MIPQPLNKGGFARNDNPGIILLSKIFSPKIILHVEGALLLLASAFFYARLDGNWLMFALLFFVPDVSIAGYLINPAVGAVTYNLAHAYYLPAILAAYGLLAPSSFAISLALIWFAHAGFDRLLGFGLKYPTRFQDTHLNRVDRKSTRLNSSH